MGIVFKRVGNGFLVTLHLWFEYCSLRKKMQLNLDTYLPIIVSELTLDFVFINNLVKLRVTIPSEVWKL